MRLSVALYAAALMSAVAPSAFAIPLYADSEPSIPLVPRTDIEQGFTLAPTVDSWQHVNLKRGPPTPSERERRRQQQLQPQQQQPQQQQQQQTRPAAGQPSQARGAVPPSFPGRQLNGPQTAPVPAAAAGRLQNGFQAASVPAAPAEDRNGRGRTRTRQGSATDRNGTPAGARARNPATNGVNGVQTVNSGPRINGQNGVVNGRTSGNGVNGVFTVNGGPRINGQIGQVNGRTGGIGVNG
ncbi:hypothetical protein K474DRAFT_1708721 [Panus rudis PR-1116 ss-1]|nr:hypothetical protein K474DRAFT_1708721 [Panus rudis PR-1116 ss-1]